MTFDLCWLEKEAWTCVNRLRKQVIGWIASVLHRKGQFGWVQSTSPVHQSRPVIVDGPWIAMVMDNHNYSTWSCAALLPTILLPKFNVLVQWAGVFIMPCRHVLLRHVDRICCNSEVFCGLYLQSVIIRKYSIHILIAYWGSPFTTLIHGWSWQLSLPQTLWRRGMQSGVHPWIVMDDHSNYDIHGYCDRGGYTQWCPSTNDHGWSTASLDHPVWV